MGDSSAPRTKGEVIMSPTTLRGIVGTPVTPFTSENEVDVPTMERLLEFHVTHGSDALALPMHLGESLNLTADERHTVAEMAVKVTGGRIPVIINVSLPGTDQVVDLARHAESVGADGVVVVTPYHWRPSDDELLGHFTAVAEAIGISVLLYNFPARLGVGISPELLKRIVERCPNVVGMKDASYDMQGFTETIRVVREVAPDFSMFTGVDYPLAGMTLGGQGCFSPSLQVAPHLIRRLVDDCLAERYVDALPVQQRMSALWQLLKVGYPASVKAALELMGRAVGGVRRPIMNVDTRALAQLRAGLEALDLFATEPVGW